MTLSTLAEWYLLFGRTPPSNRTFPSRGSNAFALSVMSPRGESTRTWILVSEVVKLSSAMTLTVEQTVQFGLEATMERHLSVR